jgi:2-polyprenyl-6-methoxyphenol hydroxylase-like FAD-dependent oxidoreductase
VPDITSPVAIVGAGPVGLALALGLARHGVDSVVIEQSQTISEHSKAAGIHIRTREILRRWGAEARCLEEGELLTRFALHDAGRGDRPVLSLDLGELADEAERPGLLVLEQSRTERILLDAVRASGHVTVRFGAEVVGLQQGHDGVELAVDVGAAGRQRVSAAFVVGCDGASSFVREALDLPFEGTTYRLRPMLADVTIDDDRDLAAWPRLHDGGHGLTAALRLRAGMWRIIHLTTDAPDTDEVADEEVGRRVASVLGPGPVQVVWRSRFTIHRRSSPRFRSGRALLAGDAAHVHSPVGGQGMNAGIQDAADLAWRLAAVVDGADADRLLDAYDVERREVVVGSVSRTTDLATRLVLQAPRWVRRAGFALQRKALRIPRVRRRALRRFGMLDLRPPITPLPRRDVLAVGTRLPDPVVTTPAGEEIRLHRLLAVGWTLLEVGGSTATDGPDGEGDTSGGDRSLPVDAVLRFGHGALTDPTGSVASLLDGAAGWILVRPDGHLAWAWPGPTRAEADLDALIAAVSASAVR